MYSVPQWSIVWSVCLVCQSHDDDILCLAIDESRNYVATGQTAPLKRSKGQQCSPTVSVWDVHSMQAFY